MNLNDINYMLDNGYLPDCLYFVPEKEKTIVDFRKITYNDTYKSYEYYAQRFPFHRNIIGFNKVIESIAEKNSKISPLEELKIKSNIE